MEGERKTFWCESSLLHLASSRDLEERQKQQKPAHKRSKVQEHTFFHSYSGTSLIRTPMGQKKVSFIERCPYFRG